MFVIDAEPWNTIKLRVATYVLHVIRVTSFLCSTQPNNNTSDCTNKQEIIISWVERYKYLGKFVCVCFNMMSILYTITIPSLPRNRDDVRSDWVLKVLFVGVFVLCFHSRSVYWLFQLFFSLSSALFFCSVYFLFSFAVFCLLLHIFLHSTFVCLSTLHSFSSQFHGKYIYCIDGWRNKYRSILHRQAGNNHVYASICPSSSSSTSKRDLLLFVVDVSLQSIERHKHSTFFLIPSQTTSNIY